MTKHSVFDLITQAGPLVQLVMLALLAASVVSWAIIFDKWRRYRRITQDAEAFEERFWSGGSVASLFQSATKEWPDSPMVVMFSAGFREWKRWESNEPTSEGDGGDLVTNVRRAMTVALNRELENLEKGLTFLATVGSTSPFVGLFGTVWGIMNAFLGLTGAKASTLTMVAPGIAEALIATAMGLVAAIPSVIAYNKYSSEMRRLHAKMDNFGAEFLNILERRSASRRRGQ
ncbi:Cell division and transport-associated protein TolQ [Magnetococcus marinus MC-1]|uniref:Tol-Pal system protein TolQ n=1 Tax=Magnetococcus marinus (strain ATCC BAA-1437 / JCM 17883 / MC-1) TaxID=156889 RepID=A0L4V3_MAGMM|nr:protein TolQ [Magnetococcus marinus]ABK42996.1 Cell division and transport-associated protein TolQ [Magnetococcus marinus MC-1]